VKLWTAGYKHPRRRRLIWVAVVTATEREAATLADSEFARLRPRQHQAGYLRYAGPLPATTGSVSGVLVPEVYRASVRAFLAEAGSLDTR
jgi:hypothetical protein